MPHQTPPSPSSGAEITAASDSARSYHPAPQPFAHLGGRGNEPEAANVSIEEEVSLQEQPSALPASDSAERGGAKADAAVIGQSDKKRHSETPPLRSFGANSGSPGTSQAAVSDAAAEFDGEDVAPLQQPASKTSTDESGPWAFAQVAADSLDASSRKVNDTPVKVESCVHSPKDRCVLKRYGGLSQVPQ